MAATFAFKEDNGALSGGRGTTQGTTVTTCNWKNIDDATTTAYSASPITAGNNSYIKYQYGDYSGSFNQISAGLWSPHTAPAGALATGLTLKGLVSSTYATPVTTAVAGSTDYTTAVAIGSGATVLFSTGGPNGSTASTLSAAGQSQYLISQLQTSASAAAGDMASITLTLQYNEN